MPALQKQFLAGALAACWLASESAHAQRIYYTTEHGRIRRADLDGSNIETPVVVPGTRHAGIALDAEAGKMYWADEGNKLRRADIHGTNIEDFVFNPCHGLDLDLLAGKVYWNTGGTVRRANLDGSEVETVVSGFSLGRGLAVDAAGSKVYWVTFFSVRRANLDGSAPEFLVTGLDRGEALDLDLVNGKLYFSDRDDDVVRRANLDGTGVETVLSSPDCRGIVVDPEAGWIYWSDEDLGVIQRANLDGSDGVVLIEDMELDVPKGLALDLGECGGHGVRVDGFCVCEPGWGGDNCDCSTDACDPPCAPAETCLCGQCFCDANCPNSCFFNGDCECGTCMCAPGWGSADCSCLLADCLNDCSGNGTCVCGLCVCDAGWFGADCGTTEPRSRVFMRPGFVEDIDIPDTGPTIMYVTPGLTPWVEIWVEIEQADSTLGGYQLVFPWQATPTPGATGELEYCDWYNGTGGGVSSDIQTNHPDWLFALQPFVFWLALDEHPATTHFLWLDFFSIGYSTPSGFEIDPLDPDDVPNPGGQHYLGTFAFHTSAETEGTFVFDFQRQPTPGFPPYTEFYGPGAEPFPIDQYQPLHVIVTVCGNGAIEGLEECDDGNDADDDGCSDVCRIESNWACSGEPSTCHEQICGNGLLDLGETCDDGNTAGGDGCSSDCSVEGGFVCSGQPSVCVVLTTVPIAGARGQILLCVMLLMGLLYQAAWRSRPPASRSS